MATLYLVPNTLDLGATAVPLDAVIPRQVMHQAARLTHWIAEDAKVARLLLRRVHDIEPLQMPLQSLSIQPIPRLPKGRRTAADDASHRKALEDLLLPLAQGHDMGLVSDAGLPAVADPGSEIVALAHRQGSTVMPLAGPNSLMMALCASGLHGQSFAFVGYLPQAEAERAQRIRELEVRSRREHQTQLLIETPYRNASVFEALTQHLQPTTLLSVSCGLTLEGGWSVTRTVTQWRAGAPTFERQLPAVFSFLA